MCWRNQDGTSSIAGFVYVCPNGYQSTESVLLSVMVVSMVFVLFITMNEMVGKFVTLDVFFKNVRLLAIGSSFRLRWHKNFSEVFIFFRVALFDVDIAQVRRVSRNDAASTAMEGCVEGGKQDV